MTIQGIGGDEIYRVRYRTWQVANNWNAVVARHKWVELPLTKTIYGVWWRMQTNFLGMKVNWEGPVIKNFRLQIEEDEKYFEP